MQLMIWIKWQEYMSLYEEAKGHTPNFVGTIVKILRNCNSSQKIFERKIL